MCTFRWIAVLPLLFLTGCAALAREEQRMALAVRESGPIVVLGLHSAPHKPGSGSQASDKLLVALSQAGFTLVDRSHLDRILQEQSLAESGVVDETAAVRTGKLLGARILILGAVDRWEGRLGPAPTFETARDSLGDVQLRLRAIEVETGRILWVGDADCREALEAFRQTLQACAERATEDAVSDLRRQLANRKGSP